ncbi:hypothetical protein L3X38_034900 [Prunus dulcis]|uniref:RNase H type-1 domain-containing protein n=1 Tax=Prunus dulcis TaxID=3755 RepID=A0AAD4VJQ9_PRUDU|nr:hypothetical protein L3X38_034900 [Prunus dulcis]
MCLICAHPHPSSTRPFGSSLVTSRDQLHCSTILSALGPPLCPHDFVSGSSRATSQWVTHPGIALAPNSLNFGVPTIPKSGGDAARFFQADFKAWLFSNLCSKSVYDHQPWLVVFVFTCWFIWKWRNSRVFNAEAELPVHPKRIIASAVSEWLQACHNSISKKTQVQIMLAWEPPVNGVLKLNVDGSRKGGIGCIDAGGIIRDSFGDWMGGFAVNLGIGQTLDAEL